MSVGAGPGPWRPEPGAAPPGTRRLGILGGTFDPPHLGHLAVAEEARDVLDLERVLFIPAGRPWQKADRAVTPAELRLAMVERAIAGNPAFAIDRREVDRPGPTYTVDTLAELAAEEPPGTELWLVLAAEALAGLATWREPGRVLELARVCAVPRGPELDAAASAAGLVAAFPAAADRIVVLDRPRLAISSTEIRERVAAGRSIRYLVPDAVAELVARYALYRPVGAAAAPAPDA